jgi:hypothetical protein
VRKIHRFEIFFARFASFDSKTVAWDFVQSIGIFIDSFLLCYSVRTFLIINL